jgi:hypothetical protein
MDNLVVELRESIRPGGTVLFNGAVPSLKIRGVTRELTGLSRMKLRSRKILRLAQ